MISCHVFIRRPKNNIYREGNFIYVSRIKDKYCPVGTLERYMMKGGMDCEIKVIFHCLDRFGFLSRLTLLSFVGVSCPILVVEKYSRTALMILVMIAVNLIYTVYVRVVRQQLSEIMRIYQKEFLRCMVDGTGHGNYNAKDMYILDDVAERLKASSSLGL